jgi:hypothetical protein
MAELANLGAGVNFEPLPAGDKPPAPATTPLRGDPPKSRYR